MSSEDDLCEACGGDTLALGLGGCTCLPEPTRELAGPRTPTPREPGPRTPEVLQAEYANQMRNSAAELRELRNEVSRIQSKLGVRREEVKKLENELVQRAGLLERWVQDEAQGRVYFCDWCLRSYPTEGSSNGDAPCVCGGRARERFRQK